MTAHLLLLDRLPGNHRIYNSLFSINIVPIHLSQTLNIVHVRASLTLSNQKSSQNQTTMELYPPAQRYCLI